MSAAGAFGRWWIGELAMLVPASVRRMLAPSRDRLLALVGGETGPALALESGGRRNPLGSLSALDGATRRRLARAARAGRLAVTLAAPEAAAVTRRVSLPLAAEADLAAVIGFEMDRLTPFAAEELYWRCAVVARREAQGTIEAEIAFVPRAPHSASVAALVEAGLPVEGVALIAADGALLPLRGADAPPAPAATRWGARLAGLGAAACAALCAAWVALTLQALEREALALEAQAASLRRAAVAAEEARLAADAADAARLAVALREQRPFAAAALAELSELLPDEAHLTALRLTPEAVEITGRAADAAGLVALIDASPRFAEPRFLAPITRESGEAGERFTLSARREDALATATEGAP